MDPGFSQAYGIRTSAGAGPAGLKPILNSRGERLGWEDKNKIPFFEKLGSEEGGEFTAPEEVCTIQGLP